MPLLDELVGIGILTGVRALKKAQASVLEDVETIAKNQRIKVQQTTPPAIKVETVPEGEYEEEKHG